MIAIDLSNQQVLDVDPKAIPQISFTGNLNQGENVNDNTVIFFIIEDTKETILDSSQEAVRVSQFHFVYNNIKIK